MDTKAAAPANPFFTEVLGDDDQIHLLARRALAEGGPAGRRPTEIREVQAPVHSSIMVEGEVVHVIAGDGGHGEAITHLHRFAEGDPH